MVKYGYVVFNTPSGKGYLTAAIYRPTRYGNKYVASFSFCSPSDQFVKMEGRMKAFKKLGSDKSVTFTCDGKWHDVMRTAFEMYVTSHRGNTPRWALKSIKRDEYCFGLKQKSAVDVVKDDLLSLDDETLCVVYSLVREECSKRKVL